MTDELSVREAGRRGGRATAAKHGPEFYAEIGRKGGAKGGYTTSKRYGKEFYAENGRKGGARLRELIEAGKKALQEQGE